MNKFPPANFDESTIFSNSGTSDGAVKGWEARKSGLKQALGRHISGGEIDDAINSVRAGTEGPLAAAQRLYRGTSADTTHFNGLVQLLEGAKSPQQRPTRWRGPWNPPAKAAKDYTPEEAAAWRANEQQERASFASQGKRYFGQEKFDGDGIRRRIKSRIDPDGTDHDVD